MSPSNAKDPIRLPKDFLTKSTFLTVYGCVVAAYIATSAINGAFAVPSKSAKISAFFISIAVAYFSLFLTKVITAERVILTLFNGFLIYLTLVGATSFSAQINPRTAERISRTGNQFAAAFLTPLNQDKNLVSRIGAIEGEKAVIQQSLKASAEELIRKEEINRILMEKEVSLRSYIRNLEQLVAPSMQLNRNLLQLQIQGIREIVDKK